MPTDWKLITKDLFLTFSLAPKRQLTQNFIVDIGVTCSNYSRGLKIPPSKGLLEGYLGER